MKGPVRLMLLFAVLAIGALAVACGSETIKEVQVPGETIVVEKEVIKEVEVDRIVTVEKEVIVEVPGETVVVEKQVVVEKEVIREVPVETTVVVEKEVVKIVEVQVPGETIVVEKKVEVIREVEVVAMEASDPTVNGVTPPSFVWEGPTPTSFNEAPMLAELVSQGRLPSVEQRLPTNPLVTRVTEAIGEYGGTWRMVSSCGDKGESTFLLHDQVIAMDLDDDSVGPALAESWSSSADWKNWTINLRPGLKWSDGAPFGADDFVFAVRDVAQNTDINPNKRDGALSGLGGDAGVGAHRGIGDLVKVDDNTVRYEFDSPAPGFLKDYAETTYWGYATTGWRAGGYSTYMPAHFLKQFHAGFADAATLDQLVSDGGFETWQQLFRAKAQLAQGPVMSPWYAVDDSPGTSVWERNPYYWKVDPEGNQLPYVDRISYSCGEDKEVIQIKVLAGESDFHHAADFEKYPLWVKNGVKGNYHTIIPKPGITLIISYNQDYEPTSAGGDDEILRLMTAKDFRVAVSLSIDKQSVTDTYLHGWGKPQNMSFHPGALFYDRVENTRNLYTVQDVDRSNALLDGLGLAERDGDGWRIRGDGSGNRLDLRMDNVSFATGGIQSDDLVEGVGQYIRDVGLNLTSNLVAGAEWGAYTRDNKVMMGGPYGFQGGRYPPLPDRHWGAKMQTWAISGGRECCAPTDPKMKRMYDLAALAGPLPYEDRGDYYVEMYNILSEEQYITGVQYGAPLQNSFTIVKNNFKNTDAPGWISRYQNGAYAAVRPEQFFFEGGKNDEGY